jgi:hypothetical protein
MAAAAARVPQHAAKLLAHDTADVTETPSAEAEAEKPTRLLLL